MASESFRLTRCPPPRQSRGTRLNTIIEDSRESQFSEKTEPSPPPAGTISRAPPLRLKTTGLQPPSRLNRVWSPLSTGSLSSCSDTEWQHQMRNFDDLYDATDDDSDMSDDCTSFASSRPTIVSPVSRKRYPSLTIPSPTTFSSLNGAPKSSPVPPTPPPKIPVSPAALSMLGHSVPAVHAPPSLDGTTPDLQSLPDADWSSQEIHVQPDLEETGHVDMPNPESNSDIQSIEIAVENVEDHWQQVLGSFPRIPGQTTPTSHHIPSEPAREDTPSDGGLFLPEDALATLRHITLEGTPDPWSETSEGNEEIAGDATPASDISGYSFSRLSIPSPGGFFSSLGPRARHTWSIPKGYRPPTSATAENFYNLPFGRTEGEVVEQVIECNRRLTEEQLTAVYDPMSGPPTAIRVPPENSDESQEHPESPVSDGVDGVHEIVRPDTICEDDEQDENYESELQKKSMASLDRTSVWLAAQASYLSALRETNPVNAEDIEADARLDDESESQDTAAAEEDTQQITRKRSVRFAEDVPEAPSSGPSAMASKDSIYWRGFQFIRQQSNNQDTFVHRNIRFDAIQSLLGNYELVRPERPAYKGPFSQAPRNSVIASVLAEKAQFSMLEKEQMVLSQISQSMWAMDALRYLNGGNLIASPAAKRLSRYSTSTKAPQGSGTRRLRVLDLGGHASCEWAWQFAHDYRNVKVYTAFTEHQAVNHAIKGPSNHQPVSVQCLWKLPFPDNKFDVISARSLPALLKTEHPPGENQDEYDLCLKECYRCLKPGGVLEFFVMDAEISRAGQCASAASVEFAFNLKTRGYDPTPTKRFLSRLRKGDFVGTKRAWMFLPMGIEPVKPQVPRETPEPRVKSQIDDTTDVASWLLKLQIEMGREQDKLLEGIGSRSTYEDIFFKTLTNQTVIIELKNDIRIRGTLKSVDQYLNIKLDDVDVLDLDKYPHLSSVKNMFIRGSVKTDGPPQATSRQSRITQFATKSERSPSSGNCTPGLRRESSSKSVDTAGGLFLEDKNGKGSLFGETGANTRTERARSRTPDDIWGEDAEEEDVLGDARYNENGSAVKKRKVDSPLDRQNASNEADPSPAPKPPKARHLSGPFIDESDSEDDIGEFGNLNEEPPELKTDTKSNEGQSGPNDNDDNSIESKRPISVVPPLVREATSHVADEYTNFDDIEEDEFKGEEEFIDQENDLEEMDADEAIDFDDLNDCTGLEECNMSSGGEVPTCPICQAQLPGLSEADMAVHVNDCLDGKPSTVPAISKPASPPKGSKPADRASIARPAQKDPHTDKSSSKPGSAFSKLMAGNAEDSAWATAAAREIMPGFSICVDAFRYGAVEGCNAYFLTHFHSDHYIGLTSSWRHVRQQLRVDPKWLVGLEFEKKHDVPGTNGVQVTLIEANHCPGSALFLFEKTTESGASIKIQRILHCGDFRASPTHVQHPLLRPEIVDSATGRSRQQRIDACYLDTTYLSPKYAFPSQGDVIKACADLCAGLDQGSDEEFSQMVQQNGSANSGQGSIMSRFFSSVTGSGKSQNRSSRSSGRLLVVIGTYSIGKERICLGIARALKSKIYATAAKQRVCNCLDDTELSSLLTDDPHEAQVHMQTLFEIRAETLADYLDSMKPHFTRVVGFRPTGWSYRPPAGRILDNPSVSTVLHSARWQTPFTARDLVPQRGSTRESACFGVPYSEHSSFRELTMFCCALRIGRVIPTVNVGSQKSRDNMKGWIERWEAEKRKSGLSHSFCTMISDLIAPYGPYFLLALLAAYYLVPYLQLWRLRDIPSPSVAGFTNFWLVLQARKGHRFLSVHEAHKQNGKLVRIAPRNISIADDAAIPLIYGHGNGFLKADFYDAFVSIRRGLFNTRNREEHSRKRKTVSHTFSMKSIGQFEQYIHGNVELFVKQWNRLAELQGNPKTGYATLDALNWFNYLAFDIIGDLAFGAPFGMLEKGKDIAEMRKTPDAPPSYVQAVEVLNRRGEVSATLGCFPSLIPFAKYIPDRFFKDGMQAVENLAGIAVARVNERLRPEVMANNTRVDLLARLMEGKDSTGNKLGREELTAEALTQLIAGSDTTSNTSCAILYWCMRTPGVIEKLHRILDEAIPQDVDVPTHSMVKDIPYLQWVIWETMRIHSTSAMGLPREIPPGSPPVEIAGHVFQAGDVVSVPSYTIHRSTEIWGPDAEEFVPERWDPARLTSRQKAAFIPFSTGPRACVGRNVAEMELLVICATVFRLFEFEMQQEGPMETSEGFLRKPLGLQVGMKKRVVA
ncbi:p450-domain-containing protein [Aspergillus steynii IBT 23096]|uniref:Benzoate 4-monooxygenase bphA n=1 Tax=Aspergillus steynii IBT 23096 TaxID=1392250 RepID=A0A2I2GDU1_9EURO|nr:p450-domain-containing protein [Aspergillus steynii IBT 23096]PLB51032.1 p450-domain-containing protein [Aspergillus steynii IBT 23096]